jgi:hypothetical protein
VVGAPVIFSRFQKKTAILAVTAALAASIFSPNLAVASQKPGPSDLPTDIPSVHIVPGSVINLVSSESKVPVRVQNDFDTDVRVQVHMLPSNTRVTVPNAVEVVVPAQSGINAQVPVKAIGNGKVFLIVWLTTFSGLRLTDNAHLQMNVNAGIEFAMLVVFSVSVVGLAIIGILRTRAKLRRKARLEASEDGEVLA